MYQNIIDPIKNKTLGIYRISDGASIPFDSENNDYLAYLDWVAEGNTAQESTPEI